MLLKTPGTLIVFYLLLIGCSESNTSFNSDLDVKQEEFSLPVEQSPWGPANDSLQARVFDFHYRYLNQDTLQIDFNITVENAGSVRRRVVIGPLKGTEGSPNIVVQRLVDSSWRDIGSHWLSLDIGSQNILDVPAGESSQFTFSVRTKVNVDVPNSLFKVKFGSFANGSKYWSGVLETGSIQGNVGAEESDQDE